MNLEIEGGEGLDEAPGTESAVTASQRDDERRPEPLTLY